MATTSKSNIWAQVEAVLASHKVKTIVIDELKAILAPKTGGSVSNPSYEKDGITFHYCRFHQQYEAEQDMVMSVGKSKGYCKASISLWNKTNAQIKRLEANAVGELTRDNIDKAKELSNEAKALGERLNDPEFYNYENDWANFNA
jgi:hypothetical protein